MAVSMEQELRKSALFDVAKLMVTAARTAPKARGIDNLSIAIADGDDIRRISDKMKQMHSEGRAADFFVRDADNILKSEVMVLIGTKIEPVGLPHCGLCGFESCDEKRKHPLTPCAFNASDLGTAAGSAAAVAADARVDNRIMFTAGMAVRELKLFGDDVKVIYGIPLSCTGKNVFFDRK
ncbi:MAG: hypothetical protein JW852_08420 [Spirochaetales bacterium]|nr:hypothetical protein [Spirochaetales bacterium]